MKRNRATDKQSLQRWDDYRNNLVRETPIPNETEAEQRVRVKRLLGDFEQFCYYYFPNYTSAKFAKFHLRFAKKVIDNDNIYIVRAWAREHAKSVTAGLFLTLYLKFTGKSHNMLYVSNSYEKAEELLMPVMINLESNQRLIHDFGVQKSWRGWEVGKFVTADGCSFRALGAGQSPRGSRNEEKRPDLVLIDDIDTDEESRNQSRIDRKFQWIERALFPAMSVSGNKRFILVGNIISKESIIVKASRVADDYEQINILDKNGQPSWNRYSLEAVNYMLSKISYAAGQAEYFNNPITEGTVFKDIVWGKIPPLSKFRFVVCYTDPSFKDSKKNDFKATVVVGELEGKFYIIKAYVEQTTTAKMIDWHYQIADDLKNHTTVYFYIEANFMQDTFLEEFRKAGKLRGYLSINGDDRAKPDKYTRIEATLEPLNRQNRLIFNEAERDNPHMRRLEEQFKAIEPSLSTHDDGPDATEGGVYIINTKLRELRPIKVVNQKRSSKKY
jgi:phage terminase large subunit-like protein